MTKDNVMEFKKPDTFIGDPITDVLRTGARKLLAEALEITYGNTSRQRCWVHKPVNVLNKLPKRVEEKAKEKLHQIWMAHDKAENQ